MKKSISFSSGKGGVGKTNLAVNIGLLLAASGKKVLLFDADFGLANVDILINLRVKKNIVDFFVSESNIQDLIHRYEGLEDNFHIIPGVSGIKEITELTGQQLLYLMSKIGEILGQYDYLLIDTGAGIHDSVLRMNAACDEIVVLMSPEPTSITDGFALMKTLYTHYNLKKFSIIYNFCTKAHSLLLFKNLCRIAKNISQLDLQLKYLGFVESDTSIKRAVQARKPVLSLEPRSKVAKQIKSITQNFYSTQKNTTKSFLEKFFGFKSKKIS